MAAIMAILLASPADANQNFRHQQQMKTSYRWLQEYVEIPWDADTLAEELTMAGLEVEGIERINDLPDDVVVAKILERAPHPNADRLSVCMVDDGSGQTQQVVCGAPNCDAGKKAVFGRIGATLPGNFTLKKAKLRGVESFGMLCALDELGLGQEHAGIIILPDDAPVGVSYKEYLGVDTVIDWEVTPNRPDWLSHYGIARDIAALTGKPSRMPEITLSELPGTDVNELAKVIVEDPDLCPRYTARIIRNVKIGPSPKWMRDYLRAVGLRPINNVVDITNFVMMELGQPLHAFDYEDLAQHTIIVRRARPDETITTLDDQEHKLTTEHLLICDAERGVALAGVMGGANSEIAETTTTVLLESAAFHAPNIRATSRGLGLITDSSYRFERGVDVEMTERASARAAQLICEYAGGELVKGMIDVRKGPYVAPRVSCRYQRACSLIGLQLTAGEITGILERLGMEIVSRDEVQCTVAVPSHRLDIEREADLIEEIARIHGLNRIPTGNPTAKSGGERRHDSYYRLQQLRDKLLGLGLDECQHNNFLNEQRATRRTGFTGDELIQLANPISNEFAVLRPTLLPNMLQTVAHNIAHDNHDLALFEIDRTFCRRPDTPEQRLELAIGLTGRRHPERYSAEAEAEVDFSDLRGCIDELLDSQRLTGWRLEKAEHPAFRKGFGARLLVGENEIGVAGEVHPELVADMRIKHPLYVALIQVDRLWACQGRPVVFQAMPQYPSTTRDIAFLADESLTHQAVLDAIAGLKLDNLERVALFDIFRDEAVLGKGKKSMAYSFTFRHPERTLNDKEVNKAYEQLRDQLPQKLPIEMR